MKSLNNIFKTICFLTLFIVLGGEVQAGGEKYEKKMGETLAKMGQAQDPASYLEAANQFLIIAKAEKKEWLPYYYHAYSNIIANFMNEGQPEVQDPLLDEARASIDKIMEMEPQNAEVHALNAFCLMARLAVDPASRGQEYSMKTQMAVGQGMAIDKENLRLRYVKLSTDMGSARFFGQDTAPYCEAASELMAEFDEFEPESPLHPTWGKYMLTGIVQDCDSKK